MSLDVSNKVVDGDASGETFDSIVNAIRTYLGIGTSGDVILQRVERQVVAGTNWKVVVKRTDDDSVYNMVVWQRLPVYGGTFTVTSSERVPPSSEDVPPSSEDVSGKDAIGSGDAEDMEDPELDAAVSFALQALSQQSNSLAPFQLQKLINASKRGGSGAPVHDIRMKVVQGCMAEHTVDVSVTESEHGFVLSRVSYE